MLDPNVIAPERIRPLRRSEYERLIGLGLFADERIELVEGALVEMTPQGSRHAEVLARLTRLLVVGVGDRGVVRVQLPLAASDHSEPEPDVAVVAPGDYSAAHPTTALLVIEVAEASREKDRMVKAALYAAAGVPEYWLVDLVDGVVEVRKAPMHRRYGELQTHRQGTLRADAFPDLEVPLAHLLP